MRATCQRSIGGEKWKRTDFLHKRFLQYVEAFTRNILQNTDSHIKYLLKQE